MRVQWLRSASLAAVFVALVGAGVAHAQSTVSMTGVEFAFQPATVRASAGSVTFSLRNGGQLPHNIRIDGMASNVFAENVTAGQTGTATVTLTPGTYTFWCPVGMHRAQGMEGTLTVAGVTAAQPVAAQPARAGGFDPLIASGVFGALGALTLGAGLLRRRRRT